MWVLRVAVKKAKLGLVDCCCRTLTACGLKNVFSCECKNLRKMDYQTVTLLILALSSAELP